MAKERSGSILVAAKAKRKSIRCVDYFCCLTKNFGTVDQEGVTKNGQKILDGRMKERDAGKREVE